MTGARVRARPRPGPRATPVGESDGASSDGAGARRRIVLGTHGTEQRARRRRARDVSAAVTQTTRSASSERGVDPTGGCAVELERAELVARRVVHHDRAAEVARAGRAAGPPRARAARPGARARPRRGCVCFSAGIPSALELVDHGGDRLLPRIDRGRPAAAASGGSTTIVDPAATRARDRRSGGPESG